ncbi:MAG: hypothetical protein PUC82_01220 [bacterium]|nr:hypothetical protein [bacterium]
MEEKEIDYKKLKKRYEKLGAKEFKKVVMEVEKLRWKITKKFFPNYLEKYEKSAEKELNKALKKATTEEERQRIINSYRRQILTARREYNREENRNYHLDAKRPTEIIGYLKYNKSVHQNALIRNAIISIGTMGFIVGGVATPVAATILIAQGLSAIKNWQCINLQNYNICRIQIHKKALEQREIKRQQRQQEKYSEVSRVMEKAFETTKEPTKIPTVRELAGAIETKEQLEQMREWLKSIKETSKVKDDTAYAK